MSEIIDNFNEVTEGGEYLNNNSCFELEDKLELTWLGLTNNITNLSNILNLIYDLSFNIDDDITEVFSSIDNITEDQNFFNKLKDVVVCFIFSNLDFEEIKQDMIDVFNVEEYFIKLEQFKVLTDFESVGEEGLLDLMENEDYMIELDVKKEELQVELTAFLTVLLDYIFGNFGIDDEYRDNINQGFTNFDIEDFTDYNDFLETFKGVMKTSFIVSESENLGIIGDDENIKHMETKDFFVLFVETYSSIFEWFITDFSLDFSNIEDFLKNYNSESLLQLRLLYYIFDSFKYDIEVLKTKILQYYMFNNMFNVNYDLGVVEVVNKDFNLVVENIQNDEITKSETIIFEECANGKQYSLIQSVENKRTNSTQIREGYTNLEELNNEYFKNFNFMNDIIDHSTKINLFSDFYKLFLIGDTPISLSDYYNIYSESYDIRTNISSSSFIVNFPIKTVFETIKVKRKPSFSKTTFCEDDDHIVSNELVMYDPVFYNHNLDESLYVFSIDETITVLKQVAFYDMLKDYNLSSTLGSVVMENDFTLVEITDNFLEDIGDELSELVSFKGF